MSALEYASGQTAEVVGKPETEFFTSVLGELGCAASDAVMIGDVSCHSNLRTQTGQPSSVSGLTCLSPLLMHIQDVVSDISGAQAVGMRGVLVRTG